MINEEFKTIGLRIIRTNNVSVIEVAHNRIECNYVKINSNPSIVLRNCMNNVEEIPIFI